MSVYTPDQGAPLLARVTRGATRCLLAQHRLLRIRRPSELDDHLSAMTEGTAVGQDRPQPWLDLLVRAYEAGNGPPPTADAERALSVAAAAFAATVWTLDVLDDLVDGDEPDAGRQAPNVALALVGETAGLLSLLPPERSTRLLALWSSMWTRAAAAQARDVALSPRLDLSIEQALTVAEGSGLVTRWAVEVGAIVAGTTPNMVAMAAAFGEDLGTAEKLLHDVRDLWPGPHPSRDLRRPNCSLALAIARQEGAFPPVAALAAYDDDTLRHRLLQCGALHQAWAYADLYRLRAADALERFARAGGNAAPLIEALSLPDDVAQIQQYDGTG